MLQLTNRKAAILPMFAIVLPVLLVFCMIAINFSQMQLARTELKIATDAAARSGGRAWSETQDLEVAKEFARKAAADNMVGGSPLVLSTGSDNEILFGTSIRNTTESRFEFKGLSESQIKKGKVATALKVKAVHALPLLFRVGSTERFAPTAESVASQLDRDIALVIDRSGSMAYFEDEDFLYNTIKKLYDKGVISEDEFIDGATDYQGVESLADRSLNDRKYSEKLIENLDGNLRQYAITFNSEYRTKNGAPDFSSWDLLEQARAAFFQVLNESPQKEQVSVSSFASDGKLDLALTFDLAKADAKIDAMYPTGSTAIGDGLLDAFDSLDSDLSRSYAASSMIVFTDGENKKGISPLVAGKQILAKNPNVIINTVTFTIGADQDAMKKLAKLGSGKHFHANDGTKLIEIFRELASSYRTVITE